MGKKPSSNPPPERAPWDDDAEPVIPPGVKVTRCPPQPTPRGYTAQPPEDTEWDGSFDFFSDDDA